ncbi:MAG: phage tail protein [Pseudomonadota bacterium]
MNKPIRPTIAPFLRFSPAIGWPLENAQPGVPDISNTLRLNIAGQQPISVTEPFGSFGGRTLPRGLDIHSEGRVFLADPEARVILTRQVDALDQLTPLWPARPLPNEADPYTLVAPTDVAVAPTGDLVIVDQGAGRVLVMAYPTAYLRHVIEVDGSPIAVGFDPQGRAYILRQEAGDLLRFDTNWRLDPSFPKRAITFNQPRALAMPNGCAEDCTCGCECDSIAAPEPLAYVLDSTGLYGVLPNGRTEAMDRLPDTRFARPALRRISATTLLYNDPHYPGHEPLKLHGLTLSKDGRHLPSGQPILALPDRLEVPRYGQITTQALDSQKTGFVWDRIALDVQMPIGSRLLIRTMTSDSLIEDDRLDSFVANPWSDPLEITPTTTPEVLIQSAPGRYLWLRIEMFGDGETSPELAEIDIYGPRRSSLNDLPASLRQDPESAAFLDRYLSYFDTIFSEITAQTRGIAQLFDAQAVPDEFLSWLGSWFDLQFFANWPEETRRTVLRQAIAYYRIRGTVSGLQQILRWHTGLPAPLPQVIEHFRLPSEGLAVGGAALAMPDTAHRFTIVIPASAVRTEDADRQIRRLIDASIPAHTSYDIRLVYPGLSVGQQSMIGVDTLLGSLDAPALGDGQLGGTFSTDGPLKSGPLSFQPNPTRGTCSC